MNQALKQRLVGTLVLGCLAIIFIPLLLDGEGVAPSAIELDVPPAPDLSWQELPPPQRPVIEADTAETETEEAIPVPMAEAETAEAVPVPVAEDRVAAGASEADRSPQRDASGLPEGWTVRVGVFGNAANADTVRACLITEGFPAFARPQGNGLTGIFAGLLATRAEADALAGRVRGECGLTENGLVMRDTLQ